MTGRTLAIEAMGKAVDRLTAERDAALAECERLRAAMDMAVRAAHALNNAVSRDNDGLPSVVAARCALADCERAEADAAQRAHAAADPHCTCNDCMADHIAGQDDDEPVCEVAGCGKPCATHCGYVLEMCAEHERQCSMKQEGGAL